MTVGITGIASPIYAENYASIEHMTSDIQKTKSHLPEIVDEFVDERLSVDDLSHLEVTLRSNFSDLSSVSSTIEQLLFFIAIQEDDHYSIERMAECEEVALDDPYDAGMSALQFMCHEGNLETAKLLLESGGNINFADANGDTPLIEAVRHEFPFIVGLLIEHGANLELENGAGIRALHFSAMSGNVFVFSQLLQAGADPLALTTSERVWNSLHLAIYHGHEALVREMIYNKSSEVPSFVNFYQNLVSSQSSIIRPIPVRASAVNANAAQASVNKNRMILECIVQQKRPLHLAAERGEASICRLLLDAGAQPDSMTEDETKQTPLQLASRYGNYHVVAELSDHVSRINPDKLSEFLNQTNAAGQSAIDLGCAYQHPLVVHVLFSRGVIADPRLFFTVAAQGDPTMLRTFLNRGFSCKLTDGNGMTPLHVAVASRNIKNMRLLLEPRYLAALELKTNLGQTSLHLCAIHGDIAICQDLLAVGADPTIRTTCSNGDLPLHVASRIGHHLMVNELIAGRAQDPNYLNAVNLNGESSLSLACTGNYTNLVRCLLYYGAKISSITFSLVAMNGQSEIVALLHEKNSQIAKEKTLFDKTPLELSQEVFDLVLKQSLEPLENSDLIQDYASLLYLQYQSNLTDLCDRMEKISLTLAGSNHDAKFYQNARHKISSIMISAEAL